jgi:hypothetical protein
MVENINSVSSHRERCKDYTVAPKLPLPRSEVSVFEPMEKLKRGRDEFSSRDIGARTDGRLIQPRYSKHTFLTTSSFFTADMSVFEPKPHITMRGLGDRTFPRQKRPI